MSLPFAHESASAADYTFTARGDPARVVRDWLDKYCRDLVGSRPETELINNLRGVYDYHQQGRNMESDQASGARQEVR